MVTIRSVRLPDEIVGDLDEITRRRGIKSFNQLVLKLIDKELDIQKWKQMKARNENQERKEKRLVVTPKILRYIFDQEWDLIHGVADDADEIYGCVWENEFNELVAKGLIKTDGSPVAPWTQDPGRIQQVQQNGNRDGRKTETKIKGHAKVQLS